METVTTTSNEPLLAEAPETNGERGGSVLRTRSRILLSILLVISIIAAIGVYCPYPRWSLFPNSPQTLLAEKHEKANLQKDICRDPEYSLMTLKTDYEQSYFALLADTKSEKKFEASDVVYVNDTFYTVCDNSYAIGKFHQDLRPFNKKNVLIGEPQLRGAEDSGWEAIVHYRQTGTFFVTREAVSHEGTDHYHAHIMELSLKGDSYHVIENCPSEFSFESGNKGFEGMILWRNTNDLYLIGLCEGNHCKGGEKGKDRGHGRMVIMKKAYISDTCIWETVKILKLPADLAFQDYSAGALYGDALAITSQEDSKLWIGKIHIPPNVVDAEILPGGKVFHFPRDDNCDIVYCNIEGISFLNERMLVAVSDQMKKHGKQDFRCLQKDQSLHVFSLPASVVTVADEQGSMS